jgi:hypothetical protein
MPDEERSDESPHIEALQRIAEYAVIAFQRIARNAHVHVWDIIEVWQPPRPPHPRMMADRITIVLVRCRTCDLPETVELSGNWTLEEITRKGERDQ